MEKMTDVMFQIITSKDEGITKKITRELFKSFFTKNIPSMKELADRCFVSQSMITKYSKNMGFSGYRELSLKIKMEIQDYNRVQNNEVLDDYELFLKNEKAVLNSISEISVDKKNIINIKNGIKKAKKIYIIASPTFVNEASNLTDLLLFNKMDVIFFKSIKYALDMITNITKDDYIIFIIGGQDSGTAQFIYNNLNLTETNHAIFLTYSKFFQFENSMSKILIDTNYLPHDTLSRKIILNYFFLQLFNY